MNANVRLYPLPVSASGVPEASTLGAQEWCDFTRSALIQTAALALGCEDVGFETGQVGDLCAAGGVCVAVSTAQEQLQLAMFADEGGRLALARALLMLEPTQGDPSGEDVESAFVEVVNIVAGLVVRDVAAYREHAQVALPIAVHNMDALGPCCWESAVRVEIGSIHIQVLMRQTDQNRS